MASKMLIANVSDNSLINSFLKIIPKKSRKSANEKYVFPSGGRVNNAQWTLLIVASYK